jgi:predicted TIM-barrel fold metal-dependent hydrolase
MIDVHRHLWGFDWFPPSHLRRTALENAKRSNRTMEQVLERIKQSPTMEPTGTGAISEMEHYGIDVSFILALDWGMAYGPEEDNQLPVEVWHKYTSEACERNPGKLYWTCGVDPRRPKCVAFLEQCVKEWGAVGWKVYPPNGYQANSDVCMPMYKKCVELDIPILIHVDSRSSWTMPEWVGDVARQIPELRIMMGHTNLQAPFETGNYWRGLTTGGANNVWLDLCDWQALGAVDDVNLPQLMKVIRVFLDRKGPDRIVWGTDLPQTGVGGRARSQTERWADIFKNLPDWGEKYGIRFSAEERDGICFKAAESVYSNVFGN